MRLLAVLATLLLFAGATRAEEPLTELSGVVPKGLAALTPDGDAPDDLAVPHLVVWLGLRDRDGLAALLAAQQDPRSPRYRQWIDATEIADRFGARRARYGKARAWFAAQGLQVVADSPYRTSFTVAGTVAQVQRALRTKLRLFRVRGQRRRAPTAPAFVPQALGVRGLLGLDDLPSIRPLAKVDDGSVVLGPADVARAYGVDTLQAARLTGNGSSIAVVARSDYDQSDVTAFAQRYGGSPKTPQKHFVGVNPGIVADAGELTEVLLDVQWAGALAPQADVRVVIGSPEGDIPEAITTAVEERLGQIVSVSFGLCEPLSSATVTEVFDGLYTMANLQGQTVVVAAGDSGSTDCAPDTPAVAVSSLASSPHAIGIGGTTLDAGFDQDGVATGWMSERVWSDTSGAGGGGLSRIFARPIYQLGLGFAARALPDVSLAASALTPGYAMIESGEAIAVGGTSAGAPVFASLLALANERAGRTGLGQLLPTLYRLGQESFAGARPAVFHDIVDGNNGFPAGPGFDLASGLGSPIADRLVEGIAETAPAACDAGLDCLVPAPGAPQRACAGQWLVDMPTLRRSRAGIPSRKQFCRDGDPSCDLDGQADGQCTIEVALCLNVFDVRKLGRDGLPVCPTTEIRGVRLLTPGPHGRVAARARVGQDLDSALGELPPLPTMLDEACTARVPVAVPLRDGRDGRLTLRARVRAANGTARPSVTLVCQGG
jgi:subtilase family serine protease